VPGHSRADLWQLLTPEQREQVWRTLTPEQRSDLWRGLQPQERQEMRDRVGPGEPRGTGGTWGKRRQLDRGDQSAEMMTAEERQRMREQIREAHRMRRERLDAERRSRAQ
jgi:hypothetical protein